MIVWLLPLTLLSCGLCARADDYSFPTYVANYHALYKGRSLGSSQFVVRYDGERQVFVFRSETEAKGLLKLIRRRPVIEHSEFSIENGRIVPLLFRSEDGTRKGEDNLLVQFDWTAGVATVTGSNGATEIELSDGILDRGSIQVAVMRDIQAGEPPGPYTLADEGELRTYEYTAEGSDTISTPVGEFETLRFRQTRAGSSRFTLIWFAPELNYVPVLIEQHRGDETRAAFELEAVQFQ